VTPGSGLAFQYFSILFFEMLDTGVARAITSMVAKEMINPPAKKAAGKYQ